MSNAADGYLGDWLSHRKSCRCTDCQLERAQKRIAELEKAAEEFQYAFEQYVPMSYVVSAFEKMERMQKSDPNCIPLEIESLIVSVADFFGVLDEEDDSGPEDGPSKDTAQSLEL